MLTRKTEDTQAAVTGKTHQEPISKRWFLPASTTATHVTSRVRFDLVFLIMLALAITFVAAQFDALEVIVDWTQQYEEYEIDEILTLLILMSFALSIFARRRIQELRTQIEMRNAAESKIRHLAMHDPLTGLPNRLLFSHRLEQELARARRENKQIAVFALDLDKFKQINDLYGHGAGDGLLIAVAERLRDVVRKMDTVARLGGDEFAVIQPSLDQPPGAAVLGARIVQALAQPFEVHGHEFVTSVSIGITLSTAERQDPSELLRAADIALYRSKAEGRSTYRFFEADMDEQLRQRQELERDLREAIAKKQLELHYQPLYTIADRQVIGFEALLRWNHPIRGQVPPIEFIPLAEETSLIQRIGEWVLVEACQTATTWPERIMVAVNVSPVQFKQKDLPDKVKFALSQSGLAPNRLEIEITESVLMHETETAMRILNELKALGVRIAMDDFGTGYSSLSYLRKFPFDKIKIDRSFITDLEQNEDDAAIVRAVVAMGQSLKMTTLAEGIESANQLQRLSREGCDQAQGFLLGRPMGHKEAKALLLSSTGDTDATVCLSEDSAVTERPSIR